MLAGGMDSKLGRNNCSPGKVALSPSSLGRYGGDRRVRWNLQSYIVSKKSDSPTRLLPDHHSPVRSIAEAWGTDYVALETFEAARNRPDSIVILEGDCGGTIYLTVPIYRVTCGEVALNQLLSDIDAMCWADLSMALVLYEVLPIGGALAGGMGGGQVVDGLWLHPKLKSSVCVRRSSTFCAVNASG